MQIPAVPFAALPVDALASQQAKAVHPFAGPMVVSLAEPPSEKPVAVETSVVPPRKMAAAVGIRKRQRPYNMRQLLTVSVAVQLQLLTVPRHGCLLKRNSLTVCLIGIPRWPRCLLTETARCALWRSMAPCSADADRVGYARRRSRRMPGGGAPVVTACGPRRPVLLPFHYERWLPWWEAPDDE